jgi:hypothetical protein
MWNFYRHAFLCGIILGITTATVSAQVILCNLEVTGGGAPVAPDGSGITLIGGHVGGVGGIATDSGITPLASPVPQPFGEVVSIASGAGVTAQVGFAPVIENGCVLNHVECTACVDFAEQVYQEFCNRWLLQNPRITSLGQSLGLVDIILNELTETVICNNGESGAGSFSNCSVFVTEAFDTFIGALP